MEINTPQVETPVKVEKVEKPTPSEAKAYHWCWREIHSLFQMKWLEKQLVVRVLLLIGDHRNLYEFNWLSFLWLSWRSIV